MTDQRLAEEVEGALRNEIRCELCNSYFRPSVIFGGGTPGAFWLSYDEGTGGPVMSSFARPETKVVCWQCWWLLPKNLLQEKLFG